MFGLCVSILSCALLLIFGHYRKCITIFVEKNHPQCNQLIGAVFEWWWFEALPTSSWDVVSRISETSHHWGHATN